MSSPIISAGDFSSTARYLFELYTGDDGIENLLALPTLVPKQFETNFLEFKSGITGSDEIAKGHWSKALGSFANSSGGVMIWGIRADREDASKVDAAHEIVPAPDALQLADKLKSWQPPATDPPIRGVELKVMLLPGEGRKGLVVCYIPGSDSKPHRSEFGKDKGDLRRWNIRMSDSTQEIPPAMLRQLFYPKVSSRIQVELEQIDKSYRIPPVHTNTNPPVRLETKCFRVSLRNIGTNTISDIALRLRFNGTLFTYRWNSYDSIYDLEHFPAVHHLCSFLRPDLSANIEILAAFATEETTLRFEATVYSRDTARKQAAVDYSITSARIGSRQVAECLE